MSLQWESEILLLTVIIFLCSMVTPVFLKLISYFHKRKIKMKYQVRNLEYI